MNTTNTLSPAAENASGKHGETFNTPSLLRPLLRAVNPAFWRSNFALGLSLITLVALLTGWIGSSLTDALPTWGIWLVATIAFAAGGYTGLTGAIAQARLGKLDIDFLMIVAALGAAAIGQWQEGALLLFLFTLSGALEEFAMDRTRRAIEALADLRPDSARIQIGEREQEVHVATLQVGDVVLVRPGERLPVDGLVIDGSTTVDQSPITGESIPVHKGKGSQVLAGTINGSGALEVRVSKLAAESTLSKIIRLVEEAQQDAAPTQRFIDRFSQPYTYLVIGLTLLTTLVGWLFVNEPFSETIYRAMTLLVVASPCALIISTPASILSAIAAAARNGVLFKGGAYLEKAAQIQTVAFDKTGTLTHGQPVVTDVVPLNGYDAEKLLHLAASAEMPSEHHVAQTIVDYAHERGLKPTRPDQFEAVPGQGIWTRFDPQRTPSYELAVGNEKLLTTYGVAVDDETRRVGSVLEGEGKTAVAVAQRLDGEDWRVLGYFAVADSLRPEAVAAVAKLRERGVKIVMLTGDNDVVAQHIGGLLGMDAVYSSLMPEQKVEIVRKLAEQGDIAMIGDGVNDAPALANATLGVAMGAGGTDVALETADVVLMSSDLSKLPFMLSLGQRADRIVRQNVIFAVLVIASLITATVIVPIFVQGFVMPLPLGVVGHEGSTLLVVINGLRMLAMRPAN